MALLLHTQSIYFNTRTSAFPSEKGLPGTVPEVKPLLVQWALGLRADPCFHPAASRRRGGLSPTAPVLFLRLTLTIYFLDLVCNCAPSTFCAAEDGLELLIVLTLPPPPKCRDLLEIKRRFHKPRHLVTWFHLQPSYISPHFVSST